MRISVSLLRFNQGLGFALRVEGSGYKAGVWRRLIRWTTCPARPSGRDESIPISKPKNLLVLSREYGNVLYRDYIPVFPRKKKPPGANLWCNLEALGL